MHRAVAAIAMMVIGFGAGVAGWVTARAMTDPRELDASYQTPPRSLLTAEVEQRPIENTIVARGVARFDDIESVSAGTPLEPTLSPVITWIVAEGALLNEGMVAYEVAGRPTFVLSGDLPLFRTVRPGSTGEDIAQLQGALLRLGYYEGELHGTYDWATRQAVERLYEDHGYEAPVIRGAAGPVVPASEIAFLNQLPRRVDEVFLERGDLAIGDILHVSDLTMAVAAFVPAQFASYLATGMPATIDDDLSGIEVSGTVRYVATRRGTDGASPEEVYFEVELNVPNSEIEGLSVRVSIVISSTAGEVLVVPLSAVTTTTGGLMVTVVESDGTTRAVEVELGLADGHGFTEISPISGSLAVGDRVAIGFSTNELP